jgi:hypothetical protein
MSLYSFRSCDSQSGVALSYRIPCKDDLDALAEGVRQSDFHAVEIFQGTRLVARVKLGNAPLDPTDPYSL